MVKSMRGSMDRKDLMEKFKAQYYWLLRNNNSLLDKIFPRVHSRWTLNLCKQEALKYTSRGEWIKGSSASYQYARRNGYLDKCCRHMESKRGHSHRVKISCSNGVTYDSIAYASRELGITKSNIDRVLAGKRKRAKGFTFSYIETTD